MTTLHSANHGSSNHLLSSLPPALSVDTKRSSCPADYSSSSPRLHNKTTQRQRSSGKRSTSHPVHVIDRILRKGVAPSLSELKSPESFTPAPSSHDGRVTLSEAASTALRAARQHKEQMHLAEVERRCTTDSTDTSWTPNKLTAASLLASTPSRTGKIWSSGTSITSLSSNSSVASTPSSASTILSIDSSSSSNSMSSLFITPPSVPLSTTTTTTCTTDTSWNTSRLSAASLLADVTTSTSTVCTTDNNWSSSSLSAASLLADTPSPTGGCCDCAHYADEPCQKVHLIKMANLDEWWTFVARTSTSQPMAESQDAALITLESELRTHPHLIPQPTLEAARYPRATGTYQQPAFSSSPTAWLTGASATGSARVALRRRQRDWDDLPSEVMDRILKMIPVEWCFQLATIACSQSPYGLVDWIRELKQLLLKQKNIRGDHALLAKAESMNPERPRRALQLLWELRPFVVLTAILL